MTLHELGQTLRQMYEEAPSGRQVTMIHLFGIRFAKEIRAGGYSPASIAKDAGISGNYATEISKGMNLSEYVVEK